MHLLNCNIKNFIEWRRNDLSQIQNFSKFPDSINIGQAIGAWKCIVDYQYKTKQV